ncbi:hypothetical protein BO85DRAFT_452800 [Aspergillus piperis CBS 112811]|uniref:Secreted protein n=1 Tax=Aspergillus piperis CBS 112811 TaxID=1448313 RepID=A0A8G1QZ42_9EURO|nr:hypothetical protein BO85DRAFT_452800 [Aspergillus piperis CBS 112811]RAH53950.1 hypothetical protein BO85DRAFT_452800 [Aspergillus piperis CBS 112811]
MAFIYFLLFFCLVFLTLLTEGVIRRTHSNQKRNCWERRNSQGDSSRGRPTGNARLTRKTGAKKTVNAGQRDLKPLRKRCLDGS